MIYCSSLDPSCSPSPAQVYHQADFDVLSDTPLNTAASARPRCRGHFHLKSPFSSPPTFATLLTVHHPIGVAPSGRLQPSRFLCSPPASFNLPFQTGTDDRLARLQDAPPRRIRPPWTDLRLKSVRQSDFHLPRLRYSASISAPTPAFAASTIERFDFPPDTDTSGAADAAEEHVEHASGTCPGEGHKGEQCL